MREILDLAIAFASWPQQPRRCVSLCTTKASQAPHLLVRVCNRSALVDLHDT
jgi:hypothetical protein